MASALAWRPRTVARFWLAVARGAASASPPKGTDLPAAIDRLKKRSEFLAVAAANRRWTTPGLVLQAKPAPTPQDKTGTPDAEIASGAAVLRVGFTATKKIGNAVKRNRARRRLRAAVDDVLRGTDAAGADLVVVARQGTIERPYGDLKNDLAAALKKLRIVS
jgi:ribonuclease P protein component